MSVETEQGISVETGYEPFLEAVMNWCGVGWGKAVE